MNAYSPPHPLAWNDAQVPVHQHSRPSTRNSVTHCATMSYLNLVLVVLNQFPVPTRHALEDNVSETIISRAFTIATLPDAGWNSRREFCFGTVPMPAPGTLPFLSLQSTVLLRFCYRQVSSSSGTPHALFFLRAYLDHGSSKLQVRGKGLTCRIARSVPTCL